MLKYHVVITAALHYGVILEEGGGVYSRHARGTPFLQG